LHFPECSKGNPIDRTFIKKTFIKKAFIKKARKHLLRKQSTKDKPLFF